MLLRLATVLLERGAQLLVARRPRQLRPAPDPLTGPLTPYGSMSTLAVDGTCSVCPATMA